MKQKFRNSLSIKGREQLFDQSNKRKILNQERLSEDCFNEPQEKESGKEFSFVFPSLF